MVKPDKHVVTYQHFLWYVRGSLAAFLVLLSAIGYVLSTKPDTAALRDGLVSSCNRENITHAQANNTALVSFEVLSIAGRRRGSELLLDRARDLTITDLTQCGLAVDNARSYKFPTAIAIGDPETGKLYPSAVPIRNKSRELLQELDERD